MNTFHENIITAEQAGTLDGLFAVRVKRSPERLAYKSYLREEKSWQSYTWADMAKQIARWQQALGQEKLKEGDRVGILLRNCPEWVMFDQAAMSLGLVVVPFYTDDRPDNVAYILDDADIKLLFIQDAGRWQKIAPAVNDEGHLERIILLDHSDKAGRFLRNDERVRLADSWLPEQAGELKVRRNADPGVLASIVYTSGTTGRPKGVMLSHFNMLSVAHSGVGKIDCYEEDVFLSFLPLSHTLERTAGYYLPIMTGAAVGYARSIAQLAEDLAVIQPTVMIAVPRIFERIYGRIASNLQKQPALSRALFKLAVDVGWARFLQQQGRGGWSPKFLLWLVLEKLVASKVTAKLGGHMRAAVSGGAALSPDVAKVFIALGLPIVQGYGLTETSPMVSVNTLEDNVPDSVGIPFSCVDVKIGADDELLVSGSGVMLGYWNNHAATAKMIDADGWLHTGDQARIENNHIFITGRIKDILVLSNGEKIPPADMESAISLDDAVEQVMVVGEGRPFLSALVVLDGENWPKIAQSHGLDPMDNQSLGNAKVNRDVLNRIKNALSQFPGYAKIRRVHLSLEPWTIEGGLITPTLKVKRVKVLEKHAKDIATMYES